MCGAAAGTADVAHAIGLTVTGQLQARAERASHPTCPAVNGRFESCATHNHSEVGMDVCPICDQPGPTHSALQHLVVQEDDETPRCGCDPRQHDTTSPCTRRAGHAFGPCVGFALDEAGKPTAQLVQFSCRDDDGEPHPTTVEAILGGR